MAFTPGLDFKLDENGDLDISTGDLQFTTGADAVAQSIRLRLLMFQGEWFRDLDRGVPWFQEILGSKTTQARLYAIFRGVIANTTGVEEVLKLTIDLQPDRTLNVVWEVRTEYGLAAGTVEGF